LWLVARNEPFRSKDLVLILRIVLSLAVAVLGATIPGFLQLKWSGLGLGIRAGGALALFALTYLLPPSGLQDQGHISDRDRDLAWEKLDRDVIDKDVRFRDIKEDFKIREALLPPKVYDKIEEVRKKNNYNDSRPYTSFVTREVSEQSLPRGISLQPGMSAVLRAYGLVLRNGHWATTRGQVAYTPIGVREVDLSGFQLGGSRIHLVLIVFPLDNAFYQRLPNRKVGALDGLLEYHWPEEGGLPHGTVIGSVDRGRCDPYQLHSQPWLR
jgi:hypothetical protein